MIFYKHLVILSYIFIPAAGISCFLESRCKREEVETCCMRGCFSVQWPARDLSYPLLTHNTALCPRSSPAAGGRAWPWSLVPTGRSVGMPNEERSAPTVAWHSPAHHSVGFTFLTPHLECLECWCHLLQCICLHVALSSVCSYHFPLLVVCSSS